MRRIDRVVTSLRASRTLPAPAPRGGGGRGGILFMFIFFSSCCARHPSSVLRGERTKNGCRRCWRKCWRKCWTKRWEHAPAYPKSTSQPVNQSTPRQPPVNPVTGGGCEGGSNRRGFCSQRRLQPQRRRRWGRLPSNCVKSAPLLSTLLLSS